MNVKEFKKEIEKIMEEAKAEVVIKTDGVGVNCRCKGVFNPISAVCILNAVIISLAQGVGMSTEKLMRMRRAFSKEMPGGGVGIDLNALVEFMEDKDDE